MNRENNTELVDLIARAQDDDQGACSALYEEFVQPVFRLAFGILLDAKDAEEVVQDSFAYAFRTLASFDSRRSAFHTWLYTITMSRCRNKRRRKWLPMVHLAEFVERLPGAEPHPEQVLENKGIQDTVLEALKHLSPKLREAVVLRYFEGLNYREMAEVLDCPQKTAESRVRLAHEELYRLLVDRRDVLLEGFFSNEQAR